MTDSPCAKRTQDKDWRHLNVGSLCCGEESTRKQKGSPDFTPVGIVALGKWVGREGYVRRIPYRMMGWDEQVRIMKYSTRIFPNT